ncbi:Mor transcription activator family protein [compost metagenome]
MTDYRGGGPELLAGLAEIVAKVVKEVLSASDELAEAVGVEVAEQMARMWGGQLIYIPKDVQSRAATLHQNIYDDWTGHNQRALAQKYGVSLPHVYTVIKRVHARVVGRNQPDLFSFDIGHDE